MSKNDDETFAAKKIKRGETRSHKSLVIRSIEVYNGPGCLVSWPNIKYEADSNS